jgi:hypothetical protein
LEADKLAVLNLCVWDKGLGGLGSFYRFQHELVFVLKKGAASHLNTVELGKNGRKPQPCPTPLSATIRRRRLRCCSSAMEMGPGLPP